MSQDLLITLIPYIVPVIIIFATSIADAYRSVPIYRGLTAGVSKQAAPKYYRAK